jgi:hypothetical protein
LNPQLIQQSNEAFHQLTKAQQENDENINNIIEFTLYMPKISNLEIQGWNQNLQIILIILHINVEPEKVLQ